MAALTLEGGAVITGAGAGIGRSIAIAAAGPGARLFLVGRTPETLEQTAAEARAKGAEAEVVPLDVGADGAGQALAERVRAATGALDLLVHSAGAVRLGSVEESPVEDLDLHYRTNLRGPYVLTQALLPLLKTARGQIVFVSSSAVQRPQPGSSQYTATKHALRGLADSLRAEVNDDGVRVISAYPGRTASPMQQAIHQAGGAEYRPERLMQPEDVAEAVLGALSLPWTAECTDLYLRPMMK